MLFSAHVGQAGIQMADEFWKLQCLEYDISNDGLIDEHCGEQKSNAPQRELLFTRTRSNRFVPRAIFVDTDDYVIGSVMRGERRQLYHRGRMFGGSCDAASTFSRARSLCRPLIQETLDETRRMFEQCDRLSNLLVTRSISGGTGSGVGSSVLQTFADEFPDVSLTDICLFPSTRYSSVITEPYNAAFALCEMNLAGMCLLFDNETMFKNCSDTKTGLAIQRASFVDVNRLMSECVSNLIVSTMKINDSRRSLFDIHRSVVRHSQMNLVTTNFAPLLPFDRIEYERLMFADLTKHLFERRCATMTVDVDQSRIDNAFVILRGLEDDDATTTLVGNAASTTMAAANRRSRLSLRDQSISDAIAALNGGAFAADAMLNFTHVKHKPPVNVPRSGSYVDLSLFVFDNLSLVSALVNGNSIVPNLKTLLRNFDLLRSKRAFMHWYLADGFDAEDFDDAREQCCLLIDAYS